MYINTKDIFTSSHWSIIIPILINFIHDKKTMFTLILKYD